MREGIDRIVGSTDYDEYGFNTMFRAITTEAVRKAVNDGKWFSFCTKINDSQIDIMSVMNNSGVKIGHFVKDFYPYTIYRSALYKYLLRDYMCYYEVPTVTKDTQSGYGYKSTYDKYIVTSCIEVVAMWLGISLEDACMTYGSRLNEAFIDNECNMFPYLKLTIDKDGTKRVSKPRKDLDLGKAGTRIIPMYALEEGMNILYKKYKDTCYNITFVKDGGQARVINTTGSIDRLKEIYGDTNYVRDNIESVYDGDFFKNPNIGRGYIRVFEVGSSIYDSPLRSINYARIIAFEEAEPDLAYINIDLDSVMSVFNSIDNAMIDTHEVVEMLKVYGVGDTSKLDKVVTGYDLIKWGEEMQLLYSTVFLRQLSLFMIGNPQWFDGYTGEPKSQVSVSKDGSELEDFEFDLLGGF